jgi:hypothetical protein
LQAEPLAHRRQAGRLAGLVVDHHQPAIGQPVDPVERPAQLDAFEGDHAARLHRQHLRDRVGGDLGRDPVDRLHQPRLPQRAHHRVGALVGQHRLGPRAQFLGRAAILLNQLSSTACTAVPRHAALGSASTGSRGISRSIRRA